ncbi:MAG: hypothetical protein ACK8QZ_10805, partial [Anaerolineales bacterium]
MKLVEVLLGQVIRLVDAAMPPPAAEKFAYLSDVVSSVKQRYKFLQVPSTLEEHNIESGLKFFNGWFTRTLNIDRLELYHNGIICQAKQPTEQI